jgi:hypothetical protein
VNMTSKERLGTKPVPEALPIPALRTPPRAPSVARRFMLLSVFAGSCSSFGPALANDQEQSQPIPPAETASETLAFADNISKLEVR